MWHRLNTDRDEMAEIRLGTLFEASGPQPTKGPQTTPLMRGRGQTHLRVMMLLLLKLVFITLSLKMEAFTLYYLFIFLFFAQACNQRNFN